MYAKIFIRGSGKYALDISGRFVDDKLFYFKLTLGAFMCGLEKRVIVFDGDSICHGGRTAVNGDNAGWAARVGNALGMEWYNYSIGGATITAEMYQESTGLARHWISRYIDVIHEKHPTLDYLILEGGTNDADLLDIGSEKFGSLDPADFSGNYDDTTFTGGLETLFYKAINYYPRAKLGYIVAQKMGLPECGYGPEFRRRHYFLRAIEVCKKWGVPYIDLWERSTLNPSLKCYYDDGLTLEENIAAGKAYKDGQHLTDVGYDIISGAIASFVASL